MPSQTRIPIIAVVVCCFALPVVTQQCYHLDGSSGGTTNTLCNPNATGTEGSHSACCNVDNADACLSTGLCLNTAARQQSHILWATGCTDATFQDPACPQYCLHTNYDNAHLRSCNDTMFCCESDADILTDEACCNSSFRLTQPIGTVIAQLQSGVGAIPVATSLTAGSLPTGADNSTSSDVPTGAIVGLAVEGVVLAITLLVLGFFMWRNRLLDKRLKKAEATAAEMHQQQQSDNQQRQIQDLQQQVQQYRQYQQYWQQPPSTSGGGLPEMASSRNGSTIEEGNPAKFNELATGPNTWPELPGEELPELQSRPANPKDSSQ
ncbi:hypothetical protein F4810DRAFT_715289 [Camillea tinctor]|nr:hypothetical protein F4810DRAFT_715289 [Camillea tinctor]